MIQQHIVNAMDKLKLKFLQQNISRAKNRGQKSWPNEITKFDVYNIGERQNWKCAITGDELEFVRGGTTWQNKWCNPQSCTIDRIDPTKGYTVDNIQLLTHKANTWKSSFTHEELRDLSERFLQKIT